MANNSYNEDSIQSLDARSHIQLRSGMYCGDTSTPNQLLLEVFSNSLDEYNIGHGDQINVEVLSNGICTVEDRAQGFIVGAKREDGNTILEASFSVINTSGKYSDDGVYEGSSLGLNGVGGKIATFLSEWLEVRTHRDGKSEFIRFEDGLKVVHEFEDWTDKNNLSGTTVSWLPSKRFFDTDKTQIKYFKKFFDDISCLCPGLRIKLSDGTKEKIFQKEGIEDLINNHLGDEIETISQRFSLKNENASLAFTFTGKSNCDIISYVNYGAVEISPHITLIKSTLTRVLNAWARENNLLKEKEKNLDGASLQEGLLLVCNIISKGVSYDAQTKGKIVRMDTSSLDSFGEELEVWLDNHPQDAKSIIEKSLIARKASEAAKKAREAVKNKAKNKDKVFKLPTTLADCWTKDRQKAELFIAEGKSAMSGLVAGRDSEFQAAYGVRGKMLSIRKVAPGNILKNQEINNIIQALGLDYDPKTAKCVYDKDKLRYGKIIAAADADPDGKMIENLLFSILWYICPELVINGHVYSSVPPLYRITTKKNEYIYLRDDAALEAYKKASNDIKSINRLKGLGEQDSDELAYCLLEAETRNLYQLTVSDVKKTEQMFEDLYGKKVEPRVEFLEKHLEEARVD